MATGSPQPISERELLARQQRVAQVAEALGFIGTVEYRHLYSQTGGAQYGRGTTRQADILTVYAEAFERDADPEDFSLEAMVAHECGHQMLARHPRIARRVVGISEPVEEILASLLGAMLCVRHEDRYALFAKAAAELLDRGQTAALANRQLEQLWGTLKELL